MQAEYEVQLIERITPTAGDPISEVTVFASRTADHSVLPERVRWECRIEDAPRIGDRYLMAFTACLPSLSDLTAVACPRSDPDGRRCGLGAGHRGLHQFTGDDRRCGWVDGYRGCVLVPGHVGGHQYVEEGA